MNPGCGGHVLTRVKGKELSMDRLASICQQSLALLQRMIQKIEAVFMKWCNNKRYFIPVKTLKLHDQILELNAHFVHNVK